MKYLVSKRKQGGKKKYEQFFAPEEGNAGCLDHSGLSDLRSWSECIYYPYEFLKNGYAWDVGKGLWTPATVRGILKNPIYTGAVVIRKSNRPSFKFKYKKAIPLEEMELVPDAHEAIVSKE